MDQVVDDTVRAARRISTDLRPLILDDLGLNAALEWLTDQFTQRAGIQCHLTQPEDELLLDNLQATAIFRIVQEALTNVTKHAQASRVDIELSYKDNSIHLLIQDDGCGFDVSQPVKSDSYGLLGFKERIYLLNGQLNLSSETGKGTRLYVCLPSSAIKEWD
jgi:signal transduction histidine kinase